MIRMILCLSVPLVMLAGCARHHVTERDVGVVDSERSVTSSSERSWTVEAEPGAGPTDGEPGDG